MTMATLEWVLRFEDGERRRYSSRKSALAVAYRSERNGRPWVSVESELELPDVEPPCDDCGHQPSEHGRTASGQVVCHCGCTDYVSAEGGK